MNCLHCGAPGDPDLGLCFECFCRTYPEQAKKTQEVYNRWALRFKLADQLEAIAKQLRESTEL